MLIFKKKKLSLALSLTCGKLFAIDCWHFLKQKLLLMLIFKKRNYRLLYRLLLASPLLLIVKTAFF
ncbi:hypothetical protein [Helicobacter pylori]|uniref:hypothetical protein n=1 Tax=Helicobacter pylori TaxID=210 RepID=UPI0013CE104D|nr:hypothetical protein [Helicobacter pylori]